MDYDIDYALDCIQTYYDYEFNDNGWYADHYADDEEAEKYDARVDYERDPKHVGILVTNLYDGTIDNDVEVEAWIDFTTNSVYLDGLGGRIVEKYDSLEDLIENELEDFRVHPEYIWGDFEDRLS